MNLFLPVKIVVIYPVGCGEIVVVSRTAETPLVEYLYYQCTGKDMQRVLFRIGRLARGGDKYGKVEDKSRIEKHLLVCFFTPHTARQPVGFGGAFSIFCRAVSFLENKP